MLSIVMALLSSLTIFVSSYFDENRDPRTYRVLQEQAEQPRG